MSSASRSGLTTVNLRRQVTQDHYATSRKVAGSNSDEVIGYFNLPNTSSRTMALGSTQPLTEMSTRNLPVGISSQRRIRFQLADFNQSEANHITTLENKAGPRNITWTLTCESSYTLQFRVQLHHSEDKLWQLRMSKVQVFRKLHTFLPWWHSPFWFSLTECKKRQFSSVQIRGTSHNLPVNQSPLPKWLKRAIASKEDCSTGISVVSRDIDCSIILYLYWMRWVVSITPQPLYTRYPLYRKLGGS
jgi:hypothetical protein